MYKYLLLLLQSSGALASEWKYVADVQTSKGEVPQKLYLDTMKNDQYVIFPDCVVIQVDIEKVILPNCFFTYKDKTLKYDETAKNRLKNGYLIGVEWDDPKTEISLFQSFFNTPKFNDDAFKVFSGGKWYTVENLESKHITN